MHGRQRGVFVGAPGDFAGNDSLRSGDCHAMFVSVMSRKRARLMAGRKNDRNAQALPLITDSMLRPSRIIVYYIRPGKDLFISAGTHSAINNRPNRKMITPEWKIFNNGLTYLLQLILQLMVYITKLNPDMAVYFMLQIH